jgi:DMSO/TMAO reductase YedYZ heme-binding membrane subunit
MSLVLAASNNGKELWYLTRGSGAVALLLLTVSVLLGVANTTRWKTDRWPRFIVYGLHRNVTLLALTFTVVHVLTTIVDSFAPIAVIDAFIPFLSPYRPFWLGLGTVAFDLLLALIVTSFLRRRIGTRLWRAVHWLAYAAWPVALLHTFGTGSDARAGWMLFLGVACGLSVLAAVMWRLLAAGDALPLVRAGATLATVGVLVGLLVWARGGPLQHGWAARAGTPQSLLPQSAALRAAPIPPPRHAHSAKTPHAAVLPTSRFTGLLKGRIGEAPTGEGLVVVTIDGIARGGFRGRFHIALRGYPLDGGGVQMTDSVVGLLPTGAGTWSSGTVTGLEGTSILSDVHVSTSRVLRVRISLRLGRSRVTGSISGLPVRV